MAEEWMCSKNSNRWTFFPIPDGCQKYYEMYKTMVESFWTAQEIKDLDIDLKHFSTFTSEERHFVLMVLAFFAGSDGIVSENLFANFGEEVTIAPIRAVYAFQNAIEMVHSEVYSLLIDTYVKDKEEKDTLFNAIKTIPAIKHKADWVTRWMNPDVPFAHRQFGFAIMEGLFFSGSFCSIFWLKSKKKCPALCQSNELISRDEGQHVEMSIMMYNDCDGRYTQEEATAIMREAVDHEVEFINHALQCNLIGINPDMMETHIHSVADNLMTRMGYLPIYNAETPFDFMKEIALRKHANFFETGVNEYVLNGDIHSTEDADDW